MNVSWFMRDIREVRLNAHRHPTLETDVVVLTLHGDYDLSIHFDSIEHVHRWAQAVADATRDAVMPCRMQIDIPAGGVAGER